MFRRSKTRPRSTQNPLRNAIEQELSPQPCPKTSSKKESQRCEKKTIGSTTLFKTSSRPRTQPSSIAPQSKALPSPIVPIKSPPKLPRKQDQNAKNHEIYITKAKEANTRGDIILAEQYYQQADHYSRLMKGNKE